MLKKPQTKNKTEKAQMPQDYVYKKLKSKLNTTVKLSE